MSDNKIPKPPIIKIPDPPPKFSLENFRGLPPPSAVDIEEAVIGCMMIYQGLSKHIEKLSPKFFFKWQHVIIFESISELNKENIPIDLFSVKESLFKKGSLDRVGGVQRLVNMTQKVTSSAHLDHQVHIILQKYILRELIQTSSFVIENAYLNDADIFDLIDKIEIDLEQINQDAIVKEVSKGTLDAKDELSRKREMVLQGKAPGIPIGMIEFDDWCGGFQERELITIAGRPGMGKTAIGVAISCNVAIDRSIPVAFFSLEMSKVDIYNRIAARLSGVPYSKIRRANLESNDFQKVLAAFEYLNSSNLKIFDTLEHNNIKDKIVRIIRNEALTGVRLVFIDYVQLINLNTASGNRTDDLNTITRELKALSNELNIPIVIFAQLNRSVESRTGNVPMLMDLKQSGSIEEDSDTVIFLLRKAYYERDKYPGEIPPHIAGVIEFIVAKGRSIGTRNFTAFIDFLKFGFK